MIKTVLGSLLLVCCLLVTNKSQAQSQAAIDDKILTEYFAKNHIKAKKTSSGLYYVITQNGAGLHAKAGQKVSMNYVGKFLDGKVFDGNMDDNYKPLKAPLNFTLGIGQVIKGWDEAVQLLNPGSRATIYLPSGIAYGPNGGGPIPPNSILVFNVELLSAGQH